MKIIIDLFLGACGGAIAGQLLWFLLFNAMGIAVIAVSFIGDVKVNHNTLDFIQSLCIYGCVFVGSIWWTVARHIERVAAECKADERLTGC
jgi:hypothetical protein